MFPWRSRLLLTVVPVAFLALTPGRRATPLDGPVGTPRTAADSTDVVAAIDAFHGALAAADTAAVRGLLAEDVMVAESGGLETREEYFSHHLPADMAFAASVTREVLQRQVRVEGAVAWVTSTSRTTGTFRGRAVDSRGAELMVLGRPDQRWRIRAIHWSSRQAR